VIGLGGCGEEGQALFHVLDGGSQELFALDEHGIVLARESCPGARALALDGEALWIAGAQGPSGRLERRPLCAEGPASGRALAFRAPFALTPGADGDLYLLDGTPGERPRLWQVEPWLATSFLGEFEGATAISWDEETLLLGTQRGALHRLRRDGAMLASVELGAPLIAMHAGGENARTLALLGGASPRLVCLERTLAIRWSTALLGSCGELAVAGEWAWVVERERLVRIGANGARELELELPLRGGPWRPCAALGGRVWLIGQGAWLEVESLEQRAWIARAQGGFEALSAGVRRRATAGPRRAGSCRRARARARALASW